MRDADGARRFHRYILALRILPRSDTERVRAVFEELFERHGLPKVIQSDNGAPFAAGRSLAGLTKRSAWWISVQTPSEVYRPSQRRLMRALVGGFPDNAEIVKLGAHGKFWLDGRHHVFVSSSLGGLQIGLERMDDGLIHVGTTTC